MTTARLALVLWFAWAMLATVMFLSPPAHPLTGDDQLAIYAVVIHDFRGPIDVGHPHPLALIDPQVLIPADQRPEAASKQDPVFHSQAILSGLRRIGLVRDTCEPVEVRGDAACRGDLPGPVLALSSVDLNRSNSAIVSILLRTVRTTRQRLYIPFAFEYEYELVPQGRSWAVTKKKQTMIT
jgi:hypothetical protein